jgi:hypothetical protein
MRGLSTITCEGYQDRFAWVRDTGAGSGWTSLNDRFVTVRRVIWKSLGESPSLLSPLLYLSTDFSRLLSQSATNQLSTHLSLPKTSQISVRWSSCATRVSWPGVSSSMSVPDRNREEERLTRAQKFAADNVEFYIDQYRVVCV